jgi:hypothetical protein
MIVAIPISPGKPRPHLRSHSSSAMSWLVD